jgi:MFS family permease
LGAGNFLAFPIGPILGGWILTNFWWGWVFLINIPIAVIGFAAAANLLPEFRAHVRPGVDLAGALPASLVARSIGSKITVAGGFALLALGLCVGASAAAASNELFVAAWLVVVGAGLGLVLTTATSAALVELSPEQSGTGSAALEAIDEIGSPLGAAILGSVVSAGYLARLGLSGLSSSAANAARQSVFAGVSVARVLRSQSLLSDVRTAFVHGVDEAMLVSAGIAVVGCVLAVLFLPRSNPSTLVLPLAQEIGAGEPSE